MKTYICGHRNPDVDSVMSAYALADLRRRTGLADVEAICAGRLPDKAKWVFDHFRLTPVRAKVDQPIYTGQESSNPMMSVIGKGVGFDFNNRVQSVLFAHVEILFKRCDLQPGIAFDIVSDVDVELHDFGISQFRNRSRSVRHVVNGVVVHQDPYAVFGSLNVTLSAPEIAFSGCFIRRNCIPGSNGGITGVRDHTHRTGWDPIGFINRRGKRRYGQPQQEQRGQ